MKNFDLVYYVNTRGVICTSKYLGSNNREYYDTYAEAQIKVVKHCRKLLVNAGLHDTAENLLPESEL